jgi:GNAT superfamily N-acetyltransferase
LTGLAAAGGSGRSYALLADGTTLTIRPAGPEDYEAVKRLHEAMSPENLYFRFFTASRVSAEREARRVCLDDHPGMVALLGLLGDELAGVASYESAPDETSAEVALAVADGMHRRGVATLLLEHLVSLARARGVQALARTARSGTWRSRPPGTVPEFADVRAGQARSIVASFLARMPGGGWLSAEEADGLLRCYGLPWWSSAVPPTPTRRWRRRPDWAVTWCSRPTCPACCTRRRPTPSNWTCTAPGGREERLLSRPGQLGQCRACRPGPAEAPRALLMRHVGP